MKIVIAGKGVWGNALFHVLSQNHTDVSFFERQTPTTTDILVLALPTASIREALSYVTFIHIPIIINACKGIEKQTHQFPHEIVSQLLPTSQYYVLMGPSFAQEVSANMPTIVNLGYENSEEEMEKIRRFFQTPFFRIRPTKSLKTLEVAGALKNIYATAAGISEGLGFGMNTRVKLMVLAIEETQRLCDTLAYGNDSATTIEVIGDLILTCSSDMSRNFSFGKYLASHSVEESLTKVNSTVEAYNTASSIEYLGEESGVSLPIAHFVLDCIKNNTPANIKEEFLTLLAKV